jgi:predicted enzyme related to lactoylglutathione lyase
MDNVQAGDTVLSPPGNVFHFVADLAAATAWYSEHGASAHRGPKTIMTGERLCQMRDPFGNLFGLRQPRA